MDERLRSRRRLVRRERGSRRAGLLFLTLLFVVAGGLFLWLRSSDVFAVRTVTANVTQYVTKEDIARAVAPVWGVSLLSLSTRAIEEALESLPYVYEARVYRAFPHRLEVRVTERSPVARLHTEREGIWLVAEDGTLLEKVSASSPVEHGAEASLDGGLPLVRADFAVRPVAGEKAPGPVASALPVALWLRVWGDLPQTPALQYISVQTGGDVVVRLEGSVDILLGMPEDLDQKLKVATAIIQQYLRDGRRVKYVDVRVPERVAVKAD